MVSSSREHTNTKNQSVQNIWGKALISQRLNQWTQNYPIEIIAHSKRWLMITAVVMVCFVGLFVFRGMNWGIDFVGGVVVEATLAPNITVADVAVALSAQEDLSTAVIQSLDNDTAVLIRAKATQSANWQDPTAAAELVQLMQQTLGPLLSDVRRTDFIGPTVGQETISSGLQALTLAIIGIFLYVWSRFRWYFAVSACLALLHDVLAVMAFFSLTGFEFNLPTIAAILTTMGYSINDTVVVFDRVRENLRRFHKRPITAILDGSIKDVLSRTVLTSVTTMLSLLGIAIFAHGVVQEFALAIVWGVLFGTYSSVFVALPTLFSIHNGDKLRLQA